MPSSKWIRKRLRKIEKRLTSLEASAELPSSPIDLTGRIPAPVDAQALWRDQVADYAQAVSDDEDWKLRGYL